MRVFMESVAGTIFAIFFVCLLSDIHVVTLELWLHQCYDLFVFVGPISHQTPHPRRPPPHPPPHRPRTLPPTHQPPPRLPETAAAAPPRSTGPGSAAFRPAAPEASGVAPAPCPPHRRCRLAQSWGRPVFVFVFVCVCVCVKTVDARQPPSCLVDAASCRPFPAGGRILPWPACRWARGPAAPGPS